MIPLTRGDIEVLLDRPSQTDYVVSAYADLRVRDGFHRYIETELKNLEKKLAQAMSAGEARKVLDANIEPIRRAVREADPSTKGLAVFSGAGRGLFHVVPLELAVENYLVADEEPYVLPLLERWFGDPHYLVATIATREVRLFEMQSGQAEAVGSLERPSGPPEQPPAGAEQMLAGRFTYKKAHSQSHHERLKSLDDDAFVKEAAALLAKRWHDEPGHWGLVLVGLSPQVAAVRRLLPPELDKQVVVLPEGVPVPTEATIDAVLPGVLETDRKARRSRVLDDLKSRLEHRHLVAPGAVEVLDALQQGRATDVVLGPRRDIGGARCPECGYRFGAPVGTCAYCGATTRLVNAVQEILRMALRQRVNVHVVKRNPGDPADVLGPLESAGDVAALVKAPANWSVAPGEPAPAAMAAP
jgi:peptide subunit release factor 1 (eRF1)